MRRLTIFLGLVLFSRLSLAPLDATPAVNRLITPRSVGPVRLGMTVAAARKALKGFSLQRTGDGEMSTLIGVLHGKRSVMTLYAGEKDSGPSINPKAVIE